MHIKINTRRIVVTAILAAIASVLRLLEFPVGIAPSFLKLDFSELPALIASFALGPVYGAVICFIKNVIALPTSSTLMAGELVNFLIGISFILPAGIIYKKCKTLKGALIGSAVGALTMAVLSVPINYYISYPIYAQLYANGNMNVIIGMYTTMYSKIDTLMKALVYVNLPFTFTKGIINILLTMILYKRISPFLKGKNIT